MSASAYKEPAVAPVAAARPRKAGRVNYVFENCTPSMLCLVRGAQSKPYTPLSTEEIAEAVQPHDLSLRPSPYIAHQALMDFYKICDGFYGVESEDVDLQQLTVGNNARGGHSVVTGTAAQHSSGGSNASAGRLSAPLAPSFSAAAAAAAASSSSSTANASAPPLPPLPSPDDPNIVEKLNDYRIAQLRRNAVHVDNKTFHTGGPGASASGGSSGGGAGGAGVCHYYRKPGGCQRGAQCPFAHLDKPALPPNKSLLGQGKK